MYPQSIGFHTQKDTHCPEKTRSQILSSRLATTVEFSRLFVLGGFPQEGTSFNGQKQQRIDITADALYNEKQENLRVWLLKFLISKKPVPEWPRSSMFKRRLIAADQASVFMAMTSDHNRSELGIHDHSNEPSSSKLVPKVVP
ncbi:hypothetical protein Tco_0821074 [Tanacetum coccineum]|uniref:Uncharacterized protein n=1 Tax=Tanacetum coccineum TaxID=301880 RepID=A0ABQ5AB88_9ASTR